MNYAKCLGAVYLLLSALLLISCTQHHREHGYIPLEDVPDYPTVEDTDVRVREVRNMEKERQALIDSVHEEAQPVLPSNLSDKRPTPEKKT